jgi:asparagine synthetase B (glutamine-hydrolysing)
MALDMQTKLANHAPVHDYHLVDFKAGVSHGGFASLEAARAVARALGLPSWEIFHGNKRVEHHDPEVP